MMIPLPEAVSSQDIAEGLAQAARKKPGLPVSALKELSLSEGRSLQILHVGTYDDEAPHSGASARRDHAGPRPHLERAPPRDLPQRPQARGTGEDENRPAPAGEARRGRSEAG